jgi:endonuclease/exonuclease/phosphatase family metal-dependent hydrolase
LRASVAPLCLGLALLFSEPGFARAQVAAEFDLLSYNVHGLPSWIAGDAPELRTPEIARLAEPYDVVLIQEDWSYHDLLAAGTTHDTVERGNGSRFAIAEWLPLFGGSGLTLLARTDVTGSDHGHYSACSGWLGGANDCLATKGWLRVRLRFGSHEVDLYNTHLDAGESDEDRAARRVQLDELAAAIEAKSADVPVVLAGDFNLRHANVEDRALLDRLLERTGLQDSGARGPDPTRHLDYILYRGAATSRLEAISADEASEFERSDGTPLSDHPALKARFRLAEIARD